MRAIVQRVSQASVKVDGNVVGEIGPGLLVLLGVHQNDTEKEVNQLASKILQLRIFNDAAGKMNLNVSAINGGLLIVSQFTLYGDTSRGNRPSFSTAARPEIANERYEQFVKICMDSGLVVATGKFQAHMQVQLVNDGPVTLFCEVES